MLARDIMTRPVTTVGPKVSLAEIARVLLSANVGAVPVVDESGHPIGVVSEWDLIGLHAPEREARRDQWLAMISEGQSLATMFVETTRPNARTAEEVMSRPVVSVGETADLAEIARTLIEHRVKQLYVVTDDRLVGVIARADLTRALADGHVALHPQRAPVEPAIAAPGPTSIAARAVADGGTEADVSAVAFRHLIEVHEAAEAAARTEEKRAREKATIDLIRRLAAETLSEKEWHEMIGLAKTAAERGEKDYQLMRFPSKLLSDGGRMVNVPDPDWPTTLRGKPADLFERWQNELKPRGFGLSARILEFPGGFPGDVGLTLTWGG
jgi:CBS domain-containing protein